MSATHWFSKGLRVVAAEEPDINQQQQSVQPGRPATGPRPVDHCDCPVKIDEEIVGSDVGVHKPVPSQGAHGPVREDAQLVEVPGDPRIQTWRRIGRDASPSAEVVSEGLRGSRQVRQRSGDCRMGHFGECGKDPGQFIRTPRGGRGAPVNVLQHQGSTRCSLTPHTCLLSTATSGTSRYCSPRSSGLPTGGVATTP
ncbi:hypothetical protein Raf01_97600 [Rugosimonospora africana]|uniref:Uncharacterized protein n=1 Tax=Rugosimonospora africana TaxID=556532 RepID=A0A8J3R398_9ACTN|nr:hypothetical protein Raf01_97600 [Rugosimonospora africana]